MVVVKMFFSLILTSTGKQRTFDVEQYLCYDKKTPIHFMDSLLKTFFIIQLRKFIILLFYEYPAKHISLFLVIV